MTTTRRRTYKRYSTILRFEKGQEIPQEGATWLTKTELGNVAVRVHLLKIKKQYPHPSEEGVTLMNAQISTSQM